MVRSATIAGPENCFRYELLRVWNPERSRLVVCMLNPSTADHQRDDPTILALIHFAQAWGYGGLWVVNLFALRTSKPSELLRSDDRVGPENALYIQAALRYAKDHGGRLLTAWGNGGDLDGRDEWFCSRARGVHKLDLICLGTTKSWMPKHPMARGLHRIPRDQQPIVWRSAA